MFFAVYLSNVELHVAALTGLCTIVGVLITTLPVYIKLRRERLEKAQALQEMSLQRAALDFPAFLENWGQVMEDIKVLMDTTEIDRFLILRAWNGYLEPKYTTAVFQVRMESERPVSYVHFELDDDYVSRLREISQRSTMYFKVEDIPPSFIKDIYKVEGVTSAVWSHIETMQLEGTSSASISYCSFATRSGPISHNTITKCSILASRLKGASASFSQEQFTLNQNNLR